MVGSSEDLHLGTSGWSYKEWIGPFYSKTDKSMLRAYTKVFDTAEIDSTFYRYPSKGTVWGWARYSPEGFVFTAKLPGLITHEKKLDLGQGVENDMQKFLDLMEPLSLGGKLGCILIQLPPKYSYRPKEFEDFLKTLPSHVRFAVEFRDMSWMRPETWGILTRHKVAYTIVDEPLLPPEVHVTSDIAYYRWHGRGRRPWYDYRYSTEQLNPWIQKVQETMKKVNRTYGFFNNHYHGYAVENCLQVLEMLGSLMPHQAQAKVKIEKYFKDSTALTETKLDSFNRPIESSLESLLRSFSDENRLKRATEIPDEQVSLYKTNARIEATVKEYHILIDENNRTIEHDCADWGKAVGVKRFCKHVDKLFLMLDRQKAADLLNRISEQRDEWQFKSYTT